MSDELTEVKGEIEAVKTVLFGTSCSSSNIYLTSLQIWERKELQALYTQLQAKENRLEGQQQQQQQYGK